MHTIDPVHVSLVHHTNKSSGSSAALTGRSYRGKDSGRHHQTEISVLKHCNKHKNMTSVDHKSLFTVYPKTSRTQTFKEPLVKCDPPMIALFPPNSSSWRPEQHQCHDIIRELKKIANNAQLFCFWTMRIGISELHEVGVRDEWLIHPVITYWDSNKNCRCVQRCYCSYISVLSFIALFTGKTLEHKTSLCMLPGCPKIDYFRV